MVKTVKDIYRNGMLQPLEPLDLTEDQVVDLQVMAQDEPRIIVKLEGAWAKYLKGQSWSYEEIEHLTHDAHLESLERTVR